ncbi:MAG: hypothetical protein EOO46_10665 [Flavobacterium sp.]|nr:MAG: hypothetical protein EOO46_10665 [Flavobacterium sp.]
MLLHGQHQLFLYTSIFSDSHAFDNFLTFKNSLIRDFGLSFSFFSFFFNFFFLLFLLFIFINSFFFIFNFHNLLRYKVVCPLLIIIIIIMTNFTNRLFLSHLKILQHLLS